MKKRTVLAAAICVSFMVGACRSEPQAGPPSPVAMTDEALGHYCQMALSEHPGPKAQVHLEGLEAPLFFSQVRDAIAYQRMPEQSHRILAIYVSDMGKAKSWDEPGRTNWAPAKQVAYVVGSEVTGGMGAPELIPFSDRKAAEAFASANGGQVSALSEIPDSAVLSPVEISLSDTRDEVQETSALRQHDDTRQTRGKD